MTGISFEMRLVGTGLPAGEITASNLAAICTDLQELATRVGRWVYDSADRGRLAAEPESATRVRISGITKGSTCLQVSTEADQPVLEGTFPAADDIDRRLWAVLTGFGSGTLPNDAPLPVRHSAHNLVRDLGASASRVDLKPLTPGMEGPDVSSFEPNDAVDAPWFGSDEPGDEPAERTVTGRLEMVDITRNRFRVNTPDGTLTELRDVKDPRTTSRLVDRQVVVTGAAQQLGRRTVMSAPTVEPSGVPDFREETTAQENTFWDVVTATEPFDPKNVTPFELTEDEWVAYWEIIDGQ